MLRKIKYSDFNEIIELSKKIFFDNEVKQKEELKKNSGYVYVFNNKIVGFILLKKINEGKLISLFGVDENYRNMGIGNLLITKCIENKDIYYLHVRKSNEKAKKLYLKKGFKEINIIKDYYTQNKEDAIYMEKKDI